MKELSNKPVSNVFTFFKTQFSCFVCVSLLFIHTHTHTHNGEENSLKKKNTVTFSPRMRVTYQMKGHINIIKNILEQ